MRSERNVAGERRKPLDVGTKQEIKLETKQELQVLQEMNRKEARQEEYPLMPTSPTRGMLYMIIFISIIIAHY